MATVLEILGWASEGLRCPDHALSFEQGNDAGVYPVTLLQMPNGTAKTTTLELLRAAMSGTARRWNRDEVMSYRMSSDRANGTFRLSLRYGGRRLTITLAFDFSEGVVRYQTTLPYGIEEGFNPPKELRSFFEPGFVHLFVFDGELAGRLLKRNATNAQDAIDSLFRLPLFRGIASAVQTHWDEEAAARRATEERGYSRRRNTVDLLRLRIEDLTRQKRSIEEALQRAEERLNQQKQQFHDSLAAQDDLKQALQEVQSKIGIERNAVNENSRNVLARMRSPAALSAEFAREMISLKDNLDRVKLPESTAREFFEELAQESHCVCGRELDDETRQTVRDRASRYLGSDDVAELNALKLAVADALGTGWDFSARELDSAIVALLTASRTEAELRTELGRIENQGVSNRPELEVAKSEIERLEQECHNLTASLRRFEDPDDTKGHKDTFGLAVLRKRFEVAEKSLAQITDTLRLKKKRDELIALLGRAESESRDGIIVEMCDQANSRIAELMPYNRIRIEAINSCLVLRGQQGGSVGETLSVAYAFLSTLFSRSAQQLPFVVDSPAGAIDLGVRPRIAELIPRLTRQFIAFTISSERAGFVPVLERATEEGIQYITLFRRGNAALDEAAQLEATSVVTEDAICVSSRSFFNSFQLDSYD